MANRFGGVLATLVLALTACGGGGGGGSTEPPPPATYTLGGTATGLAGVLILLNNGGSELTVAIDGSFTFPTAIPDGTSYAVTVKSPPPNQDCDVSNGSGVFRGANVTDISVICTAQTYTVGGVISGLGDESGLVLSNGPSDTTSIPPLATMFTMKVPLITGATYAISIQHAPPGTHCDISNGTGLVAESNISNVQISCGLPLQQILHTFGSSPTDGSQPQGALVRASDGNYYGTTLNGGAHGLGTVFKLAQSGSESILYSFAGGQNDGSRPYGDLIQASDGQLYGVTSAGGASGFGTIFRISLAGVETVLHSFAGGPSDGNSSLMGLVEGNDGSFYGTTQLGGTGNQGTLFRMTPSGTVTLLHSFVGATVTDPAIPDSDLTIANDGSFYGTTIGGGTAGDGVVYQLAPDGTFTILHSFSGGPADGATPETKVILAKDGNLYGVTLNGGTGNVGVVFKVTPTGEETVLHSFLGPPADGEFPQGNLIEGSDGNLYGATYNGGTYSTSPYGGTVYRITPSGEYTLLYSFHSLTGEGAWLWGGLIETPDGRLVGTTTIGPSGGSGTVFELY